MLLVSAVVQHMVAAGDVVQADNLAVIEGAVFGPVYRHAPSDRLLPAGHRHACMASHQNDISLCIRRMCALCYNFPAFSTASAQCSK